LTRAIRWRDLLRRCGLAPGAEVSGCALVEGLAIRRVHLAFRLVSFTEGLVDDLRVLKGFRLLVPLDARSGPLLVVSSRGLTESGALGVARRRAFDILSRLGLGSAVNAIPVDPALLLESDHGVLGGSVRLRVSRELTTHRHLLAHLRGGPPFLAYSRGVVRSSIHVNARLGGRELRILKDLGIRRMGPVGARVEGLALSFLRSLLRDCPENLELASALRGLSRIGSPDVLLVRPGGGAGLSEAELARALNAFDVVFVDRGALASGPLPRILRVPPGKSVVCIGGSAPIAMERECFDLLIELYTGARPSYRELGA